MKVTMNIEKPQDILITLTVTMTHRQWEEIATRLRAGPDITSVRLRDAISAATRRVQAEIMCQTEVGDEQ